MNASPRIEDAVPTTTMKPSATTVPLRTVCVAGDAPTGLDLSESALKTLEDATTTGDASTACTALQRLRKQYAQRNRKNWPPDTVRRLWTHAVEALRESALPEVGARACQLIEVLAQSCKSCTEGDWETVFHDGAPIQVIRAMERYPSDLSVQSSCLRALLSMTGCLTCRSFYDTETQNLMGKSNAVPALVQALKILQQLTATMQFESNAHKLARLAIADAVQALHYICLMHKENTTKLASLNGLQIIRTSIEDDFNEMTVQEHGCMLLAELAISAPLSDQEILECVGTVINVARLQMQEKLIEVARAAVWSIARIANNVLHPHSPHSRDASWSGALSQVWTIMQEQALNMILGMMESCQLKNDPLVKHCLDFIAVVGRDDGLPAPNAKTLENFRKARDGVCAMLVESDDTRIKAVSMRTLLILLGHPHGPGVESLDSVLSLDALLHGVRAARTRKEATEKDIFAIQVYGLNLMSCMNSSRVLLKSSRIHQYIQDVHEAVAYTLRYIEEGGEEFLFDSRDNQETVMEVSCCRYACHCCYIHESCTIHEILAATVAVSKFLSQCGKDGVNSVDPEGRTLLHKLAQSGLKECLKVALEICGEDVDYLQRTSDGATALQLARSSKDPSCAILLEKPTEKAAEQAQDELLKELRDEERANQKSPVLSKKGRRKKAVLSVDSEADMALSDGSAEKKLHEEDEYERALAERCKQLEDMEAIASKKTSYEKSHRCSENWTIGRIRDAHHSAVVLSLPESSPPVKTSSRFFGKEGEVMGRTANSDAQRQHPLLGTSISVGSGNNNGSPDPTAPPAGPYDDRDPSVSAFQARDQRMVLGTSLADEKPTGNWHSLFAAAPEASETSQGGLENKWSMISSSSGQNNQMTGDLEKQPNAIQQQIWPPLASQPRKHPGQPVATFSSYDSSVQDLPSSFSHPAMGRGISEDEVVDDTQILSWLSSEITGLIGNGPQADRTASTAPAAEIQKARDFHNDCVPPPPPQNAPVYDTVEDSGGLLTMDPSMSPFYSGNPVGVSPYIHQTPSNFVQSHSGPWGNAAPTNPVMVDPRLIPQSEMSGSDGRPSVHPSRFWHTAENDIPSKHLWLGNLNTRLPRSVLKSVFEEYGPIEDVVTFPGRMYAFVNFIQPEDAQRAAKELDNMTLPVLTGNRKLVIKFRPNRKALGRVGDLMPGVASIEQCNSGAIAPSISVPVFRSPDMSSPHQSSENAPIQPAYAEEHHLQERPMFAEQEDSFDAMESSAFMGHTCRHLWLGNVCVRPSRTVLFSLFSRYGPVESVRVFPGKTYAFVNFQSGEHAYRAKEALDGKVLAAITGTKALVVRFQREGAGPPGWGRNQDSSANIPTLQSAESAPGAYGSVMLQGDRTGLVSPSEYHPMGHDPHTTPSMSPEEYPPLSRQSRNADPVHYTSYPADRLDPDFSLSTHSTVYRRQTLPTPEGEALWPEGVPRDATGAAYGGTTAVGYAPERTAPVITSAAMEAPTIGLFTRTLSAAAFGRGQRPSPYIRATTMDRNPSWNPNTIQEGGYEDQGLQSSYSATLNASYSYGGADSKGYSSPFFHPQMAPNQGPVTMSQPPLWPHPAASQRPPEAILSSQSLRESDFSSSSREGNAQISLPQEYMSISGGSSMTHMVPDLDPSQAQQSLSSSGVAVPAVVSCDKGSIW